MNQVRSFKSRAKGNCVGAVASCPQREKRDKGDEGRRLKREKREKIKNICRKINLLQKTVCNSTDNFKCVEILFHEAGSKCVVSKRRKKPVKRGEEPVSDSPQRGIFFRGRINHLEFFDTPKLCAFFEKHAVEVVQGAPHAEGKVDDNRAGHADGNPKDHFATHLATHKDTSANGEEFVYPLREEPLTIEKNRLPSGEGMPLQTFSLIGKDANCCKDQWDEVISNAGDVWTANYANQPTWMNADELTGEGFTNEGKTNGDNSPQDNKRKNKQVNDSGHYSSFNKRMKLGECERQANTNSVSPEQLQADFVQFASGQHVEWDDSPRGTHIKWVMQDIPTSKNERLAKDVPTAHTSRMPPNEILQRGSTIRGESLARKKILMLKVSSIVFNHGQGKRCHLRDGESAMKKGNQLNTSENPLERRKPNQNDDGKAGYMMTVPTDEAQSGLDRKFLTDDDELEDELKIREDIQFVYNLFCILAVHMNSLFSMCTELLRYNFSDLSCEDKELSNQSKRLIKLISEYQKEENFAIRFAKCIFRVCKGYTRIGKGPKKGCSEGASQGGSERGFQSPRRGTLAHFDMTIVKKIIRTLLKWEREDENIQIMFTQNRGDKQSNRFKIEIVNHQMVKQNFDVRKLYFCKYNGDLLAYLKRLSTMHCQSSWGFTQGKENNAKGILTGMDPFEGEEENEVALNRVSLYQRCCSPLWRTTKGKTSAEMKGEIQLNNDAEKVSHMRCRTRLTKNTEHFPSTNDSDGSFWEDSNEEGAEDNTPLEIFPNGQTNLTKNQMSIILYLNKILTNEIRSSEDLRIRAKREGKQTETLLWEVKRLQDILRRNGTDVKNVRSSERVLYNTVQMETSAEFFSTKDGKDMHLMEQKTFDENEIDQSICRKETELLNVTSDAHGMAGNSPFYASAEGEKCANRFHHPDDFKKGDLIRQLPYEEGIISTIAAIDTPPPKDGGNINRVRHMIGKIFDQFVNSHVNASHPCDKVITSKVDAVKKGGDEKQPLLEPTQGIKELMEELDTVKKENSQFGEFLEREKRLASQLGLEVERQKEALMEMEFQLESERKRSEELSLQVEELKVNVEELRVHVEREELVNDALFSQMEEERKMGSEVKARLDELASELEAQKGRSDSLEAELSEERKRCSSLEAELDGEKGRSDSLEEELAEERHRNHSLEAELEGKKERSDSLEEELAEERKRCSSLEAELQGEKGRREWLEEEKKKSNSEVELAEERDGSHSLDVELKGERDIIAALKTELDGEKNRVNSLETELDEERDRVTSLETELEGERNKITSLETELEEERDRVTSLETELEGERNKITSLETELEEERDRVISLTEQMEDSTDRCHSLEVELEKEKDRVASLEGELEKEKDRVASLEGELEKERDRVSSLEGEKQVSDCLRAELKKEQEIISGIKEDLKAEKEASALLFAQIEKQREQLTQQKEENTKMRQQLDEQTERSDPLEVNKEVPSGMNYPTEATNQLGPDKKELPLPPLVDQRDKEKATMKISEGKKIQLEDKSKDAMKYGELYDEFVETVVEKEALEKENELMMNHFNGKIEMLGEQAKYFDDKISHYKILCESYERKNRQVARCMERIEEAIKQIELCRDLSDVNWEEQIENVKEVIKDIKHTYAVETVETVGTDTLLFDQVIMEKNILLEKILHLESEKGNQIEHTTDKGQTHNRKDLPNEETTKYMEEMNFKSLNDLFSFHINVVNELSFTKKCYNQLVEENLMKGREYQNDISRLKKLVKDKEREIGVSDENCKSLLLEVENLKFILNDLFTCGGGRARAIKEEGKEEKKKESPVVQVKAEEELSPVVQGEAEGAFISVLEEEPIASQEASLIAPNEPPQLAPDVSSVAAAEGDALSSVPSNSANDSSLQSNPVSVDSQTSRNAQGSNVAATSKGRRTTTRSRTSRGKEATRKGDSKGANRGQSRSKTETKTNKGTSGNKSSRGSKSIQAERGKAGSDLLVDSSVPQEGGRKYPLRSTRRRK
ncbi:hypothetical protein C922_02959 [Plasmodium inui San Antonio 1]|uniref:Uncharacterized protein n=1 Tax=Plasmodium inui San Antonio 1 TaxID=1237626 RepID=W7A5Z9_9APIC|nr:hypothetical protein C922_02959 [Plasmodium inui San Antonio 1]EUD66638.1 hypothetical protein C922_02959 [Plasmodium inui San Antonio 1]